MSVLRPLLLALSTYTALPMPGIKYRDEDAGRALAYLPIVGLLVGLLWWLWARVAQALQMGSLLRAVGLMLLPLLITGGIHMDGFLDTSDALASWQPKEKKLEILKDTHVGAFAVIRAGMYLLALLGIYAELGPQLMLPAALGFVHARSLAVLMTLWLPNARGSGMLSSFQQGSGRRLTARSTGTFLLAASIAGLLVHAKASLLGLAALVITGLLFHRMAMRRFGGITGDLAGYLVQWAELAFALGVLIGGTWL